MGALVLCIAFSDKWPLILRSRIEYVWFSLVVFIGPFGFSFMLLRTAACTPVDGQVHEMLVLQYVAMLFLVIQVANSFRLTIYAWVIGSAASLSTLLLLENPNWLEIERVTLYNLGMYATLLLLGSIANQNVRRIEKAKFDIASAIGSNIAHELRTPLTSIRAIAAGVHRHAQQLADALESLKLDTPVRPAKLDSLRTSMKRVEDEVEHASTFINMLLVNTSPVVSEHVSEESFLASGVANDALRRFPFNNSREKSIPELLVERDFYITGNRLLVVHVILNLLKNSIYYSQRSRNSRVELIIRGTQNGSNYIFVVDNGPGILEQDLSKVFTRFFTTTTAGEGAGVGLSFCRSVMSGIGGSIACNSVPDARTEFMLTFPKSNSLPKKVELDQ